jgi:cysteine synthase
MKTTDVTSLRVAENITDLVGETPLLRFSKIVAPGAAEVYAKLEYLNPGGSIKDRAAVGMIKRAEAEGRLRPGSTLIEATAGNTGIGLALIGVARGYRVVICIPEKFSVEKQMLMQALGAEVIRTPDAEGMLGAIRRCQELAAKTPDSFLPAQFENQANPDFHYETTGREIFDQMDGRIDAVCLGVGTGGTFTGVARYIKERLPKALCIAVEPQGSILGGGAPGEHKVEGIGNTWIPKTYDGSLCDEVIMVHDPEAYATVRELAQKEGVLAGSSAGCNVYAALQVAQRLGAGKRVVTIIPDSAERYLSKDIFSLKQ